MPSWMRWTLAICVIGAAAILVVTRFYLPGGFTVGPGQQALLLEDGTVVSVLDPGLHAYNRATQSVIFYDITLDRQFRIDAAVMVEDCPADVIVFYSIDDALAFHQSGGNADTIAAVEPRIREILADMDLRLDTPLGEAMSVLRDELSGSVPVGLTIIRLSADLGECAPPPPRIVTDRIESLPLETRGVLAEQRVALPGLELMTSDSNRLQLLNAVATYQVVDPELSDQCFAMRPGALENQVVMMGGIAVRSAFGWHPSTEPDAALIALAEALEAESARFSEQCGVELGALDVSDAELWRMELVNCTETPDAEICAEAE